MVDDLFDYFAIEYLGRLTAPNVPLEEADLNRQLFETVLSTGNGESRLFGTYFALESDEWAALPFEVHTWFLERVSSIPELSVDTFPDGFTNRFFNIYWQIPNPLLRYLATNAFLATQEIRNNTDIADYMSRMWTTVFPDTTDSSDDRYSLDNREMLLVEFITILLDIGTSQAFRSLEILLPLLRQRSTDNIKELERLRLARATVDLLRDQANLLSSQDAAGVIRERDLLGEDINGRG